MRLGAALKKARERAGLTLSEASYQLRDVLPRGLWKTGESIRRYELGQFNPDDIGAALVMLGLARVYGTRFVQLEDVSYARDFQQVVELIRSRCLSLGELISQPPASQAGLAPVA